MSSAAVTEAKLSAGVQLCVEALREHPNPDGVIEGLLGALATAAGHEGRVVLVRGIPSDAVRRAGGLAITIAAHAWRIDPEEDERLIWALIDVRDMAEELMYMIEEREPVYDCPC